MNVTASQMTPTSSRPSTLIPSYPQTPREEHVNTFFRKINEWERVHWQSAATENRGIASGLADVCGHESLSHDSTDSHWKAVQRERNGSAVSAIHKAFYCEKTQVVRCYITSCTRHGVVQGRITPDRSQCSTSDSLEESNSRTRTVADLKWFCELSGVITEK